MRHLKEGALAEGFATELWTLPRVGQLIEKRFGRRYSESQVWRILMSLGFSCQRPSGGDVDPRRKAERLARARPYDLAQSLRTHGAPLGKHEEENINHACLDGFLIETA